MLSEPFLERSVAPPDPPECWEFERGWSYCAPCDHLFQDPVNWCDRCGMFAMRADRHDECFCFDILDATEGGW